MSAWEEGTVSFGNQGRASRESGHSQPTRSSATFFMLAFTMTRVSRSSLTILAMRDFLMCSLAKIIPLGETAKRENAQLGQAGEAAKERTGDMILEKLEKARGMFKFGCSKLCTSLEIIHSTETGSARDQRSAPSMADRK